MPRFLTLILALIFALGSCTIEKRIFNNGYHVSWNRSLKSSDGNNRVATQLKSENDELVLKESSSSKEAVMVESNFEGLDENVIVSDQISESGIQQEEILLKNPKQLDDTVYIYPVHEPLGIVSFATSLAAYASFFAAIVFLEELIFVTIALFIIALIFGLFSLGRYGSNKIFYKKNVFGVIGTILAALPFFFLLITLLDLW